MNNIDIVLAQTDLGVNIDGTDKGPEVILNNIEKDNINDIYILNKPNVEKEKEKDNLKKNLKWINEYNEKLYNTILNILNDNKFPLTIGGDHSIAIATALASIKNNDKMGIIWVDAHSDYNTFDTTITGNIHGLPLACITGYEKRLLTKFHNNNYYPYKNTVIIGARDIDLLEYENLKDANITVFTTEDIKKYGVKDIVQKAIKIATDNVNSIHVSFDIDVIDPNVAKGVSVSAKEGISEEESYEILDELFKYNNIRSMDVVEYNPLKDDDNNTLKIAVNIVNKIINEKK